MANPTDKIKLIANKVDYCFIFRNNSNDMLSVETAQAIIRVFEMGSFTRAASALGISRAKLTRTIQQAETACGFSIFDRSTRHVSPTPKGRALAESCKELSEAALRFDERVNTIGSDGGLLKVSCGPLATRTVLQPALSAFLQELPASSVEVEICATEKSAKDLATGLIDLFIGDLSHVSTYSEIEVIQLKRRELTFVARPDHPVHAQSSYSLAQLLQLPLALPYIHKFWSTTFDAQLKREGLPRPERIPQVQSDDYDFLTSLAENTDLLTAGLVESFADKIATGKLREVKLSKPLLYNICIGRRTGKSSDSLETLWSIVRTL